MGTYNSFGADWTIDSQQTWQATLLNQTGAKIEDGMLSPMGKSATYLSEIKTFSEKQKAVSITLSQSPVWENWIPSEHLGPVNMKDAPVFLRKGPEDYWVFARYGRIGAKQSDFKAEPARLPGFDIPLSTTPCPNQYNAPGAKHKSLGGYHAWQSKDMVNWVHHGAVSDMQARWLTTAEQVGEKTYFYYDFPNDQDPHLIIDEDLTDGKMGTKMGVAFQDPSDGSDCVVIRDLEGNFHMISEDWSPLDASQRSWDSPLASHAISPDGISGFKLVEPAVDYRTQPTGRFAEFPHPHWRREDPENFPGKVAPASASKHRIKQGAMYAFSRYEIHEPRQPAYGDWAAIAIGDQYYLFGDYDTVEGHQQSDMQTAWFTASDINAPFTFCGSIGQGHPDPDIMFAQGQFYLITQTEDFISPGPWVSGVEVRVGVDTTKDGSADQWTKWNEVKETYSYVSGFAKQVARSPAELDLSTLPAGYGFQFEVRLTDSTENKSKPILDEVTLRFDEGMSAK